MAKQRILLAIVSLGALAALAIRRARRHARFEPLPADPLDAWAATIPDVDSLTRDDLYAWAKRLEIPQRSRMRKAELAEAVAARAARDAHPA